MRGVRLRGVVGWRSSAARGALALGSSAPMRSSAARAAHREVLASRSSAPLRSSAARAALRGASPLPHLLQRAMACEAIVVSLVGMTRCFGWCCRRPTCLQPCAKADNHGLTGTARCNKCGSGLAPRSAARAALDLRIPIKPPPCPMKPPPYPPQNSTTYPTITRFSSAASAKFERMLALRQRSDRFFKTPDCTT